MTDCEITEKNVTAVIKSKCYDSRPQDRYKIIYSYPSSEYGGLISTIMGDTLYFSTGETGFLTENPSDDTKFVEILLDGGNKITASLSTNTGIITVDYIPSSGPTYNILTTSTNTVSPITYMPATVSYDVSYAVGPPPILTIVVTDAPNPSVTVTINMNTQVITIS